MEVLQKRVSRKTFLKTLAVLALGGAVALALPLSLRKARQGYGSGPYGG